MANNIANKLVVNIEGNGVFGTFLKVILTPFCEFSEQADIVILAVPFNAYEEVANKHAGKHLVNVCSVQDVTNNLCLSASDRVTGIHPMFGPRSPEDGRTCIITLSTSGSLAIIDIFSRISEIVTEANGRVIDGQLHDEMMAKTHLQVIKIAGEIEDIAAKAHDVPDNCLPTSFKRLKAMAEQFLDMPPGTKSSILANRHN